MRNVDIKFDCGMDRTPSEFRTTTKMNLDHNLPEKFRRLYAPLAFLGYLMKIRARACSCMSECIRG